MKGLATDSPTAHCGGCLAHRVSFRVAVFRPFAEELLVGKVHRMTR